MNECKRCKTDFNEILDDYKVYVHRGEGLELVVQGKHCPKCVDALKKNRYKVKKQKNNVRCVLCGLVKPGQIKNHAFYCDDCKELL